MRHRSFAIWICPLLVCFLAFLGCSVEERALYAPSAAPLTGDPGQENCGFELAEEPSEPPVNPCTDGTLVFGPETFVRAQGQPQTELRPFSAPEPGGVCILVQNSGVSAAWIGVDGVDIIKPNRFNPHISVLSAMANVPAGEHELSVRLASKPGSELTVEVWFAPVDVTPRDKVVGDEGKVAVWNLFDTPDPFSPGDQDGVEDTTSLSAMVGVMHLGRAKNSSYSLRYTFEIADQADCVQIRAIEGDVPLDPSVVLDGFLVTEDWDGTNDSGDPVAEGDYYYRLVAEVLLEDPVGGIELIDYAVSRIQRVTVDNTPTHIKILNDFLLDTDSYLATEEEGGVFIYWNYTNTPMLIWGEGIYFSFDDAGCTQVDLEERIRCFFTAYDSLFGYGSNADSLLFGRFATLSDGRILARFHQHLFGAPILGADVIVTLSQDASYITRIYSKFVLGVTTNPVDSADDLYPPPEITEDIISEVESIIGEQCISATEAKTAFLLDQLSYSTVAKPRYVFFVTTSRGIKYKVFLHLDGESIAEIESVMEASNGCDNQGINTWARQLDYTNISCSSDDECGGDYKCMENKYLSTGHCTLGCKFTPECVSMFDENWSCVTSSPSCQGIGYCRTEKYSGEDIKVYNLREGPQENNGWWNSLYNDKHFYRVWEANSELSDYLCSVLGRNSWDECDGLMGIVFEDPTLRSSGPQYHADAVGGGGVINIANWEFFDRDDTPGDNANVYGLIGHEGGHSVFQSITGNGEPCDQNLGKLTHDKCFSENMADLFGALFARHMLPIEIWQVKDQNDSSIEHTASAWMDQTCGLRSCNLSFGHRGRLPYSQRSRYDLLPCHGEQVELPGTCNSDKDCPPYYICDDNKCESQNRHHNNESMWRRFARLLAEGSITLERDEKGENINLNFNGVGDEEATDIIYEAFLNMTENTNPLEFSLILASAGDAGRTPSHVREVRYSLGASGFPGARYLTNEDVVTDVAPIAIRFETWRHSDVKTWYVYKDKYSDNVKVTYHDENSGNEWVTVTLWGNKTKSSPTAVVYNERLYVFWREKETNAIRFKSVDGWGGWTSLQDLSSLSIETDGPFDVTVYKGNLYIGFVRPDVRRLNIASCLGNEIIDTGYCTDDPSDWKDFDSLKVKMLDIIAWPGISMTSGSGVNGTDGNEYIYALVNTTTATSSSRLRVAMIDETDSIVDERDIPDTFPSYRAYYKNASGIEVRPAAFPSAGNYLYLTWSWIDDRVYTSILQNWNHYDSNIASVDRAWFTRSVYTGDWSLSGVTFWRHNSEFSIRHVYSSLTDSKGMYTVIWGRY